MRIEQEHYYNIREIKYLFFRPSHPFKKTFDSRVTHNDIECIPEIVYLLIDVSGRTDSEIFQQCLWLIFPKFGEKVSRL
jgi:hypothetical protein